MDRRAAKQNKHWFVYISDTKLAPLLNRANNRTHPNILERIQVTVNLSFGLIGVVLQPRPAGGSVSDRVLAMRVAKAEEHIRRQPVGDLNGEDWIAGRVDMRWGAVQDGQTVLFCGYAGPLLVALKGSLSHLIGQPTSGNRSGSLSVVKATALNEGDPENLGEHLAAAARAMGFKPQSVRFLAQVERRGALSGEGPQREFVLATPLYVEEAHRADESADAFVQGTVQWFSADQGWGLIAPDGVTDAVVVQPPDIQASPGQVLLAGERVEFRVTHGPAGILARSVRLLHAPAGEPEAGHEPVTRGQSRGPENPGWIDRYKVLRPLGEGSMGAVYLARGDEGHVAIKVIRPEYARDPVFLQRFRDEADTARRVRAPNVARVIAAETGTERPYLVTEFIPGPTLQEQVELNGRLPEQSAIDVSAGVAAALDAIHKAGIVHRDLKPANVILSASGPKVIDFGLARSPGRGIRHTQHGMPVGTPAYMSPEQINQRKLTPASDIFSWACLTVFAATGRQPFASEDSPWTVVWREICEGTPDLSGVPAQLRDLVAAGLGKNPAGRPTAAQLLERLSGAPPRQAARLSRRDRPSRSGRLSRRRPWLMAGGAAVITAVAVSLTLAQSPGSATPAVPPPSSGRPATASGPVASPGQLIRTLSDPIGLEVFGVAFSPDGKTIAASFQNSKNESGHVDLWSLPDGQSKGSLIDSAFLGDAPSSIAFNPKNADSLAVADGDGLDMWDLASRSVQTSSYSVSTDPVLVTYTQDGKTLITADFQGDINPLNVGGPPEFGQGWTNLRETAVYNSGSGGSGGSGVALLTQVAVSPTGNLLAAADT